MNNSHQPNISVNASVSATYRGIVLIVVESCIFVVLDTAALVGNVLVCLARYKNRSLRTVTIIFILSLALTDLLMAVLVMPLATVSSIANRWIGGDYAYTMRGCGGTIFGGTSLLTVMLLAVNRYFRVVRPARYPNIFTKKRSAAMAVCAWTVTTVIVGGFPFAGIRFQSYAVNPTKQFPIFPNTSSFIYFKLIHITYMAVPSVVMAACYVKIYQTIRQHNTAVVPSSQGHSAYGVEEAKMTRLLTVVLVAFYLCWLPPFLSIILGIFKITDTKYYNLYFNFPGYASSVINPIIYATMSHPFRKEFLKILRQYTPSQ